MKKLLCTIALDGKVDFGKWTTLTAFEVRMLEVVSQLDALRMCVSVLNDNEAQKAQEEQKAQKETA